MSKAVLISIQPKWCKLIAEGRKTIELRKTMPTLERPFKCYIYQTKTGKVGTGLFLADRKEIMGRSVKNGKVIGEFVCDCILRHCEMANADIAEIQGMVRRKDIPTYANGKEVFGWHISGLVIYEKPKDLSEFVRLRKTKFGLEPVAMMRPPQSWCYVEKYARGGTNGD